MRPTTDADMAPVSVSRWNEDARRVDLVQMPCKRVIGPNELSDLRPRALTAIWRNALVPSYYSRPRALSHWPERKVPDGLVHSVEGIGTVSPRTRTVKRGQEAYALRCELGDRAYAVLTGARTKRPTAKRPKSEARIQVQTDVRRRADGGSPVVLTDHEMMIALGIKPVGYLD